MRWPTVVIIGVVALMLFPMWYVALQGVQAEPVEIDHETSEIRPLESLIDTPNALSPSQVGVIVWVSLIALLGTIAAAHRFMADVGRPTNGGTGTPDKSFGSASGADPPTWLSTEDRWIVEYDEPSEALGGLLAQGVLTLLAIAFSILFTTEYLTLARTQYFGLYAAGMFFSLAGLTIAYYAWFLPHITVAERRSPHDDI